MTDTQDELFAQMEAKPENDDHTYVINEYERVLQQLTLECKNQVEQNEITEKNLEMANNKIQDLKKIIEDRDDQIYQSRLKIEEHEEKIREQCTELES